MNKLAIIVGALLPALGHAQQATPPAAEQQTTKLYLLRYAQAYRVAALLPRSHLEVHPDDQMRALVARGTPEALSEADRLIKELDQPGSGRQQRNLEITVYVISASDKKSGATAILPAMVPVVRQLQSAFPYSNYQVLDTVLVRSREGEQAESRGLLHNLQEPGPAEPNFTTTPRVPPPFTMVLEYRASVDPVQRTIHFDKFSFTANLNFEGNKRATFDTSLDLKEGQKAVVGKTNIDDGTSAIFVVVTARVIGGEG